MLSTIGKEEEEKEEEEEEEANKTTSITITITISSLRRITTSSTIGDNYNI